MDKKQLLIIIFILLILSVLVLAVLIYRSVQEEEKMEQVDRRLESLYRNDEKTQPVSTLSKEQLDTIRSDVLSVSDDSFRDERLEELGELEKLLLLRERLQAVENDPIQDFSMTIYRELLLSVNEVERISVPEREQLYALRKDYESHLEAQEKLDEFNVMMGDLLDVDPTDPESLARLIRTIQEAGAEDLLEEHMGDLWENFELAERLEDWLKSNTDMQDLDVESFVSLIDQMQARGMDVEEYISLARVMGLVQKVEREGILALSPAEFTEMVDFLRNLKIDEAQTILQPILRRLQEAIMDLQGQFFLNPR